MQSTASPARRLFGTDLGNRIHGNQSTTPPSDNSKCLEELDQLLKLSHRDFRVRYQFDIKTLQPCASSPNLLTSEGFKPGKLKSCWTWTALDETSATYVPEFYRPTVVRRQGSVEKWSLENSPPAELSKPKEEVEKKQEKKPRAKKSLKVVSVKQHFTRVQRRSVSLERPKKDAAKPQRSASQARKSQPDSRNPSPTPVVPTPSKESKVRIVNLYHHML